MKILGFLPIHYGTLFLRECLLSVVDHVDKMHVCYSEKPSHSYNTKEVCPDTSEDIYKICHEVLGGKLIFDHHQSFSNEAAHRDQRYKYSASYDYILSIDSDEVFIGIPEALKYAQEHEERFYGIKGYLNMWKTFDWFLEDGFRPIRLEKLYADNTRQNLECPMTVYHFSTCQNLNTIRYKNNCFGHKTEIRPNWLEDVYQAWSPQNQISWLHPVSLQIWEKAMPYNKMLMPDYLRAHPFYSRDFTWEK
jgi:hypothetical protein